MATGKPGITGILKFGLAAMLFGGAGVAHAQHIWIEPRAEAKISYTDNSTLVDTDRIADTVLDVSPGLNMRIEGAHVKGAVDYAYDYLYFLSDGTTDDRHSLFGLVDAEVWEDHLTLSGRASMRETFIDRGAAQSQSPANRSANRRLVQNYTGTATLKGGLRDFADWRANYRYGLTLTPADNLDDETLTSYFSDSRTQEISVTIGSGKRFNNLEWTLYGVRNTVTRNLDVNDYLSESASAELWYKFNRRFAVVGSIGLSRNSFENSAMANDGGLTWEAGFRWTPGRKLDLSVRRGEDGPRKTWNVRLQHFFSTHLDLSATYTDTLSANSLVLNGSLQGYQFDENGGIVDQDGVPVDESTLNFSLSDVDFRRRFANTVLTWRHRRNEVFVSANNEWRTYDNDTGTAKTWGVSSGFRHKITAQSKLSGTISYRRSRFEDSVRVDSYIVGGLDWSKTLSRYFKTSLAFEHNKRMSSEAGQDLLENTLTWYLRGTF
ncbi:MAG: TIGR03016 family PEP-CTERM system-associated outer membrane protein [Alphaproteobacteria bacterium]|nr:MAG: TIGR03016 family PEP-CTERM system-associated outer membrane protein [Alphaproteobacteria bacterium]